MRHSFASFVLVCWLMRSVASAAPQSPATAPSGAPANAYLLHINGIGGKRSIDTMLTQGLVQGGLATDVDLFDWVGGEEGLNALADVKRHDEQSSRVADILTREYRARPDRPILLTGHSGGSGIAVWALEKLPADVKVDTLVMLSSALSPQYDLSKALAHVRRAYAFNSALDTLILGTGTSMFGTVDRVKTEAAGKVGFTAPPSADPAQYAKLMQVPYDPAWMRFGNIGDHIGVMMRPFAREVISTLLRTGELPKLPPIQVVVPATRPVNAKNTENAEHEPTRIRTN